MDIKWSVGPQDIRAVRHLIRATSVSTFVRERVRRNVSSKHARFSRDTFWRVMVGCLLTTQQRSGPDSAISRFMRAKPASLNLSACSKHGVQPLVRRELSGFGGIRRAPTIARQAAANYRWLESEGWQLVAEHYQKLLKQRARTPHDGDREAEREAATFIDDRLKGFGPKQARNLWQWLGLTRYEIPLDSRITKWLNEHVLDLKLTSALLGDKGYYEFVLDGVQTLCHKAGVLPCVFDGAIFSSYDREWSASEFRDSG